jgi:hypothetical protein
MELGSVIQSTFGRAFSESSWYNKVQNFSFDNMVKGSNKFFNSDNFNTPIPADKQTEYSNWAKTNVTDSGNDYDYAGAFLAGFGRDQAGNGHLPDTYKKPNHPTFSTESKYATGSYKQFAGKWSKPTTSGGEWTFTPARATLKAVTKATRNK